MLDILYTVLQLLQEVLNVKYIILGNFNIELKLLLKLPIIKIYYSWQFGQRTSVVTKN